MVFDIPRSVKAQLSTQVYLFVFVLLVLTVSVFTLSSFEFPIKQFFPSFLWITLALYTLFQAMTVFKHEFNHGIIDLWVLSEDGIEGKVNLHLGQLSIGGVLAFLILAPVIGLLYDLSWGELGWTFAFIAVSFPILILFSMLGGCLTLKASAAQLFIPILLLPLLVPIIIFGSLGSAALIAGESPFNYIALLTGILLLTKALLTPLICKALYYANG